MSDLQATPEAMEVVPTADAAQTTNAEPVAPGTEPGEAEKEVTQNDPKTYTEEEVRDRIERATAKAAAKAERRALREATDRLERMTQQQHSQPAKVDERPQRTSGEADDDYLDRLTDWKLDQRAKVTRQAEVRQQQTQLVQKTEDIYAKAEKEPGFDRDDFEALPLTPTIAQAITESDVAPKLMAYMAANPDEVARIAKLSQLKQAQELGKLEATLSAVKTSKALAPISPIGAKGSAQSDPNKMTFSQYEAWRSAQTK